MIRDPFEERIGRIRKDGGWDRRYRLPHAKPEPVVTDKMSTVVEILVGMIVMLLWIVGLLAWVAIGTVAQ